MAKKNSRDLFKQMNSNVSILEETDKSPILSAENEPDSTPKDSISTDTETAADKPDKVTAAGNKTKNAAVRKTEEAAGREREAGALVRITYNLTYDLNEKFNAFTEQYELYKTSLIRALMEGWLDGSIELDENEVLFNDGLIKIKKKAGSRKAVGSILIPAALDTAFARKCHEAGIDKNNCIFRLLKKYLEQKMPV